MKQASILQQMYVNQGQFIIGKSAEKPTYDPPKCCMHFILPMLVGSLLCGVPLASVLTLYLKSQCCVSESTTTASMPTTVVMTQTQVINQTNSSTAMTLPYYCFGTSPYTRWETFGPAGITMNISTSSCSFNSTPLYFTSMTGISDHWTLAGYTAIYYPTKTSFRVYANPLTSWTTAQMMNYAQTQTWNVNWFGISN